MATRRRFTLSINYDEEITYDIRVDDIPTKNLERVRKVDEHFYLNVDQACIMMRMYGIPNDQCIPLLERVSAYNQIDFYLGEI